MKDLAKNLISLRKFVDRGLSVYLNGKIINVFDPKTKQTFLSGNYKKPFWIIKIKTANAGRPLVIQNANNKKIKNACANVTPGSNRKLNKSQDQRAIKKSNVKIPPAKTHNTHDDMNTNLLNTIRDRKIIKLDDEKECYENDELSEFEKINTAKIWHMRVGHISGDYIRHLRKQYPDVKQLKESEIDDTLKECETCIKSKLNKLPFKQIRQLETKRDGLYKPCYTLKRLQVYSLLH